MFFNLNLNQEIEDLPQTNKTILDEHLLFNSTIQNTVLNIVNANKVFDQIYVVE